MDDSAEAGELLPIRDSIEEAVPLRRDAAASEDRPLKTSSRELVDTWLEEQRPEEDSVIASADQTALDIDRSLLQPTSSMYSDSTYQPLLSSSALATPLKPPRSTLLRKVPSKSGASMSAAAEPVTPTSATLTYSSIAMHGLTSADTAPGKVKDNVTEAFSDVHYTGSGGTKSRKKRRLTFEFFKNKWILIGVLSALFLILIIVIIGITVTRRPRPVARKPEIRALTKCGFVLGMKEDDVYIFKGIPYTRAATGEHRWRYSKLRPELADCFNDSYAAYEFRGPCVQTSHNGAKTGTTVVGSEDCLYLNIWTPALPKTEPGADADADKTASALPMAAPQLRPVFVYIHGGFLRHGSGHEEPTLPTAVLAKVLDAVVVTFNYRLNVFGFLSLKSLQDEGQSEFGSGNYGLWDQIVALTWVKDNIRSFGGDPRMVTVAGLDGGATSIYALLASPSAKGLFHRAWLSGGAARLAATAEQAHDSGAQLRVAIECKSTCSSVARPSCEADCLRGKDAATTLLSYAFFASQQATSDMQIPLTAGPLLPPPASASVDGYIVPTNPSSILSEVDIPLLIGTNSHETDYANDPPQLLTKSCSFVGDWLRTHSADRGFNLSRITELYKLYPCEESDKKGGSLSMYIQMATDIRSTCPYNRLAEIAGSARGPGTVQVYRYVSTVAPTMPTDFFGIGHASAFPTHGFDVVTFFGNAIIGKADSDHVAYQKVVRDIVRSFVRGGDLTAEFNLTSDGRHASLLGASGLVTPLDRPYDAEQCRFWASSTFKDSGWSQ